MAGFFIVPKRRADAENRQLPTGQHSPQEISCGQSYSGQSLQWSGMNLKQLQYIQEIAKEGSITAAAHNLYISQPSLSQMLRQVEQELGATLFERSSQPMRPTPAGERYLQTADTILTAYEQLETEIQGLKDENSGRLRLGISMQRSVHLLPKVLPLFLY